jgi:hypothetical protein
MEVDQKELLPQYTRVKSSPLNGQITAQTFVITIWLPVLAGPTHINRKCEILGYT